MKKHPHSSRRARLVAAFGTSALVLLGVVTTQYGDALQALTAAVPVRSSIVPKTIIRRIPVKSAGSASSEGESSSQGVMTLPPPPTPAPTPAPAPAEEEHFTWGTERPQLMAGCMYYCRAASDEHLCPERPTGSHCPVAGQLFVEVSPDVSCSTLVGISCQGFTMPGGTYTGGALTGGTRMVQVRE